MEKDDSKCKYCYLTYSISRFPYRLRCKCIICLNCLEIFKNNSGTACLLCNQLINLEEASKYSVFFSAMVEENLSFQQEQKKKAKYDLRLRKKIQSSGGYLIYCQQLLDNLKMVQNIYNSCKLLANQEELSELNTRQDKIKYLKRFDLLNMQPPDSHTTRQFIKKYLDKFLTISNEILLFYECFQVENPVQVTWLGKSLTCQEYNGCSVVEVKNVSGFDILVKGVGLFLGIKGDSTLNEAFFKVIEINPKESFLIVKQSVMIGLESASRYLFEVDGLNFIMKQGLRYSFEYSLSEEQRILVNYNNFAKSKKFSFEINATNNVGSLAYLRCLKIKVQE